MRRRTPVTKWVTTSARVIGKAYVMTSPDLADPSPEPGSEARSPEGRSRVTIERNGEEYLVIINGAAFIALSRAQAEAIVRRTSRRPDPRR